VSGVYLLKALMDIRNLIKGKIHAFKGNDYVFSSPDPKGHVSYCHHLRPSVVRRKLFQKSSPLKVLDQWKPNLV
jgi:hypothetical protein